MVETASGKLATPSGFASDRVNEIVMASGLINMVIKILDLEPQVDVVMRDFWRFFSVSVTKLFTGRLVNGLSCGGSDMVIKYLDLEPRIDGMMRDFL
nr:hypothetical protein [Tanacetum cinerariifolium]